MHFLFFVNRLQDIRTLKNRTNFNTFFRTQKLHSLEFESVRSNLFITSYLINNSIFERNGLRINSKYLGSIFSMRLFNNEQIK